MSTVIGPAKMKVQAAYLQCDFCPTNTRQEEVEYSRGEALTFVPNIPEGWVGAGRWTADTHENDFHACPDCAPRLTFTVTK